MSDIKMKAVIYTEYGPPENLQIQEVDRPVPGDNEVLVRVHAVSINSWDWDMLTCKTIFVRMWGFSRPKHTILGSDIAGRVEAVGGNVKMFKPGDEVYGDLSDKEGWGGFAEYATASEEALALKSPAMSFEEAAAIPQAGLLALQGLRNKREIKPGDSVLINGAGGGVGTMGIQIARHMGAEVTGVDSAEKLEILRSLGADHVIDYQKEDYTETGKGYDLILDNVADRSVFAYRRALNPGGVFAMIGGTTPCIFKALLLGPLTSLFSTKKVGILAHKQNKGLDVMNELYEAGVYKPVIDSRFPLSKAAEAMRHFGEGKFKGKIVITVEE